MCLKYIDFKNTSLQGCILRDIENNKWSVFRTLPNQNILCDSTNFHPIISLTQCQWYYSSEVMEDGKRPKIDGKCKKKKNAMLLLLLKEEYGNI